MNAGGKLFTYLLHTRTRSRSGADAVAQPGDAGALRAMLAAEEGALLLEPVAENADATLVADRRQRMNGAFEAVEGVGSSAHAYLERLVVVIPAGFTSGHDDLASVRLSLQRTTRAARRQFHLSRG
jgi:hypothetical protein